MTRDPVNSTGAEAISGLSSVPSPIARIFRRVLTRLDAGTLVVELPSGKQLVGRAKAPGPEAILKLNRWRAVRRLVTRGDIGFAEGYIDGDWTTPDLVTLFTWANANEDALAPAWRGSFMQRIADRLLHAWRANTRSGSRRNIAQHYDLGNAFYSAWLDSSMCYSSALYSDGCQCLETAQSNKINRAIELLDVSPKHTVLEIGCGWGALAERLIVENDCHVTGITLSREQLAMTEKRIQRVDRSGQSQVLLQDYRDVGARFDRIVSIEMFEAAGEAYWPVYFDKLKRCLNPGGIAVLQVITIAEDRFEDYRRRPDFIQRYIFPGGMLPTVTHMQALVRGAGLVLEHQEHFGQSYACTLSAWRSRFFKAWPSLTGPCSCPRFRNMWDYYLAYCEVGFKTGAIDVGLYRIRGPI